VSLVAAAVCPHPPMLVPGIASGAAAELDDLRAACLAVIAELAGSAPDLLVLVGSAPTGADYRTGGSADFSGWGPVAAVGAGPALPLSLAIGGYLLDAAGWDGAWRAVAVAADDPPPACAELGVELAGLADRVALLVMGDGSARHDVKAPGYIDPRADDYDRAVAAALAAVDTSCLRDLDPGLAADLLVAGRAPWQVLAGAATGSQLRGAVRFDAAPYGVGYLVASWGP